MMGHMPSAGGNPPVPIMFLSIKENDAFTFNPENSSRYSVTWLSLSPGTYLAV